MENKQNFLYSYYAIRKTIGILGILLPIAVFLGYGNLLSSISHYYYTQSAVFFIAILFAFGLFLISYRGYKRDIKTEWLSDNAITHIGGLAAILVVLIPTSCLGSSSTIINGYCSNDTFPLYGHCNKYLSIMHLISAGFFFTCMSYMSYFRFTKGEITPEKAKQNKIYKSCGIIMGVCIAILLIEHILKTWIKIPYYHTFMLETIAILAFGTSWLVKGKAIKDLINLSYFLHLRKP